jgi:hypothetical protein
VENLIILDRAIDYPTVLATQLTYEGLLDEVFGINNNSTEVESSVLDGAPTPTAQNSGSTVVPTAATKRKIVLDSSEKLYPELRNANLRPWGQH